MFVATQPQAGAARFGFIVWKIRSHPALFIQRPVPQVVAEEQQLKTSSLATVFWGGDCCGVTTTSVWRGKYASEESPPLSREQLALLRELSQKKNCYWFSTVTLDVSPVGFPTRSFPLAPRSTSLREAKLCCRGLSVSPWNASAWQCLFKTLFRCFLKFRKKF